MAREVDGWSLRSTPLRLSTNGHVISRATGFFWTYDQRVFLVTNWHVLSGRNPTTRRALNKDCAVPDTVEYVRFVDGGGYWEAVHASASLQESNEKPLWIEHNEHKSDVDIAAVEIPVELTHKTSDGPRDTRVQAFNTPRLRVFPLEEDANGTIDVRDYGSAVSQALNPRTLAPGRVERKEMGDSVFILGFPLGLTPTRHLPIWKRASIASEMDVPVDGLPAFLVDAATREGMSGSPVIHRTFSTEMAYDGHGRHRSHDELLGIYSGRWKANGEEDSQLGLVWRRELIEQIVESGVPGSNRLPDV